MNKYILLEHGQTSEGGFAFIGHLESKEIRIKFTAKTEEEAVAKAKQELKQLNK